IEAARELVVEPTPSAPPEVRKTVTIVFSDIVESTQLSTDLDPEVFRRLMSRYFDEMRGIVERHGGIVEKYIGDAIMAVFGATTHELVRDAVTVEAAGERTLKHGRKTSAVRVVAVDLQASGHTRRFDSPLVGRDRQLGVLRTVFRGAVDDSACHLLTVLGAAGMGKSRLVQEFLATLEPEAFVLRGRCLPYGEGITYWPLAEVVRDL